MAWRGNMVVGRRPVPLVETYGEDKIVSHIAAAETRINELEEALRGCIEWAASDCEHEACKGVIETAGRFVQLKD